MIVTFQLDSESRSIFERLIAVCQGLSAPTNLLARDAPIGPPIAATKAAKALGMHPATLYRKIKSGDWPAQKCGRVYKVNVEEIRSIMKEDARRL